jgi:cell division septation protein DedD
MSKTFSSLALLLLVSSGAIAGVREGVDAWSRGDYAGAIAQWRGPAMNGDADAQFNLGQAYKLGRGVPADLRTAEQWYRRAAQQGHIQAEDNLGLILFQNGDRQGAMPFIEKSASRGDPRAQYVLGTALFNGDLVKKDWIRAYALMTRASAGGLAPASASLAQMDRFIPADQRQRGLVLARELEAQAQRPTALPASRTTADAPAPAPARKESAPALASARPQATTPARPSAPPPKAAAASAARDGRWRIQLGAFADAAKAGALWPAVQRRVPALSGLSSYQVRAGAVTRLQAGPLADKAEADRVCRAVKAAGQPCLPVAP